MSSILYSYYTFFYKNYVLKHAGPRFPSNFEGTHDNEAGPSRTNITDILHGNSNSFTLTFSIIYCYTFLNKLCIKICMS
jgi:hypothetical protein